LPRNPHCADLVRSLTSGNLSDGSTDSSECGIGPPTDFQQAEDGAPDKVADGVGKVKACPETTTLNQREIKDTRDTLRAAVSVGNVGAVYDRQR
jgi:hypothetical protein